ncbi:MAG: tetratricopeptide repeat protein [Armatimonadetes bacterium]|nr:tetratricopeptide repeat protein [Armatimonadota bacterium]
MSLWSAARNYYRALAHDRRGEELRARGRLEEAIKEHQAAVQLSPDHAAAHHHLGMAYYEVGRSEEACALWKKVLTLTYRTDRHLSEEADRMLRKFGWKPAPYWQIGAGE